MKSSRNKCGFRHSCRKYRCTIVDWIGFLLLIGLDLFHSHISFLAFCSWKAQETNRENATRDKTRYRNTSFNVCRLYCFETLTMFPLIPEFFYALWETTRMIVSPFFVTYLRPIVIDICWSSFVLASNVLLIQNCLPYFSLFPVFKAKQPVQHRANDRYSINYDGHCRPLSLSTPRRLFLYDAHEHRW